MGFDLKPVRWSELNASARKNILSRPVSRQVGLKKSVDKIISRVRLDGDRALSELTEELDGRQAQQLVLGRADLKAATERTDSGLIEALQDASARIEAFHAADIPADLVLETAAGLSCEVRYKALSPVGLYIPGGTAPLVSTVLMLAIPARLAGCREIVMCSPPADNGRIPDQVLAAAYLCGIHRVYCVGGAQAVAAMAYGTESVPQCRKIFGPGNAWVTAAKQRVSQDPEGAAIDMPAGPSEVLVIADESAKAEFIAWDLMSQAEHGPDSQAILLSDCAALAAAVIEQLSTLAPSATRSSILERSLEEARIILVKDLAEAIELSNQYAPEHLIINTLDSRGLSHSVESAGSVFVGPWTPESLGDYCSGTNHVLPTYGWARSYGALGVSDYLRRMTFQQASRSALERVGPTVETLALVEGLEAHRMAVKARLDYRGEQA